MIESHVMEPEVSVVIVSDYRSGAAEGWSDLRVTLAALARQDFPGPVEYLLVEAAAFEQQVPRDLADLLPTLDVLFVDAQSSYALKNAGAKAARAPVVGVLDADCAPHPAWLRELVRTFEAFPDTAVVSGRTIYDSASVTERMLGLLSRGYLDRGAAGPTTSVANNNAGFARSALLAHPFVDAVGPFGGKLQAESMRRAGLELRFEPAMVVVHRYEGWSMERDIRCHSGYASAMVRRVEPRIPFAWLTRLGTAAIPLFLAGRLALSWATLLRLRRHYDVPLAAVPRGLALAAYLHWLELPGLRRALRGGRIDETAYR